MVGYKHVEAVGGTTGKAAALPLGRTTAQNIRTMESFGVLEQIKTSQDQPYFQPEERGVNPAAHKDFKNLNV